MRCVTVEQAENEFQVITFSCSGNFEDVRVVYTSPCYSYCKFLVESFVKLGYHECKAS